MKEIHGRRRERMKNGRDGASIQAAMIPAGIETAMGRLLRGAVSRAWPLFLILRRSGGEAIPGRIFDGAAWTPQPRRSAVMERQKETVFQRAKRIRGAKLTMAQTFYLLTINEFLGNNVDAWPSQEKVAEEMNASKRGVQKIQQQLAQIGVIQVESGKKKGCKTSNRYRLNLSKLTPKPDKSKRGNSAPSALFKDGNSAQSAPTIAHPVRTKEH